ncbi:thiamine phosphate synthase [Mesorhizobium sp. M0387]|uniref:thiamine phosphate synthase n=1 Tax=Mesorhizobium sp. M0387 TaxID=2956940 RepID=UPI00333D68C0
MPFVKLALECSNRATHRRSAGLSSHEARSLLSEFRRAGWVDRLAPLGVRLLQLRIMDMDEKGLQTEIRRANDACAVHGCQVSVNDNWRTAIEEGCDFVHLGQKDLAAADADD